MSPPAQLPVVLIPHPHVRIDQNVLGGSPYIVGSRVPVRRLWLFYRGGAGVDTLMKRYPQLSAGKIFDALAFAFDNPEVMDFDIERESHLLHGGGRSPGQPAKQMDLPFDGQSRGRGRTPSGSPPRHRD